MSILIWYLFTVVWVLIVIFSSVEKSTDSHLLNSILDVEDLVKFGNKQRWDLDIHYHLCIYSTNQSQSWFIWNAVISLVHGGYFGL